MLGSILVKTLQKNRLDNINSKKLVSSSIFHSYRDITEDLNFPPPLSDGCIFWSTPKCERNMERQRPDFSRGFLF